MPRPSILQRIKTPITQELSQKEAFPLKPTRNLKYLAWIRTQSCIVCGRIGGIEAAHTGPHGIEQMARTPPPFLCAHDITELVATPTINWDLVPLSCSTDLTSAPLWRVSMKSHPFGLKGVHSSERTGVKNSCSGPCRFGYAPLFAAS